MVIFNLTPNGRKLSGADLDEHKKKSADSWRLPLE
jgi:hypothetical protein